MSSWSSTQTRAPSSFSSAKAIEAAVQRNDAVKAGGEVVVRHMPYPRVTAAPIEVEAGVTRAFRRDSRQDLVGVEFGPPTIVFLQLTAWHRRSALASASASASVSALAMEAVSHQNLIRDVGVILEVFDANGVGVGGH